MILHGKADDVDTLFAGYVTSQLWKQQRPDSAFAVVASAIQYNAAAFAARGTAAAEETSDAQFTASRDAATGPEKDSPSSTKGHAGLE